MDGSVPAYGADSARRIQTRFQFGASVNTLQSGLFEQLLCTPTSRCGPTNPAPPPSVEDTPPIDNGSSDRTSDTATSTEANSTHPSDEKDVDSGAEEEAEKRATEEQAALLATQPAPATDSQKLEKSSAQAKETTVEQTADEATTEQPLDQVGEPNRPIVASGEQGTDSTDVQVEGASLEDGSNAAAQTTDADRVGNLELRDNRDAQHPKDTIELPAPKAGDRADQSTLDATLNNNYKATDAANLTSSDGLGSAPVTQADASAKGEGRTRGDRREKWYERVAGSDQSRPNGQENLQSSASTAASNEALNLTDTNALDSSGTSSGDTAADPQNANAVDLLPESITTTALSAGQAIPMVESASASLTSVATSLGSLDSSTSLGGEQSSTSTMGREGVEPKSNASPSQRADAKSTAGETQRSDGLTQAERVRLVQRVSRSFARLGPAGGQINIKLHPPQLGSLNVQVKLEGRSMTAKLSTETSAARDAILESLPVLRSRLAEQGFEITSFQVEVADNNSDATRGDSGAQSTFDQATGGDGGSEAGQRVDYRRLAAQHRQPVSTLDDTSTGNAPRELAWQRLAGVDLQA